MFDFFIHEFDVFVDELAHLGLIPEDWDPLAAPTHEAIPDPVHTDPNWQIHDPTQDPIFHGDFHLDNPHVDPNVPTEQAYTDHPTETHLSDGSTVFGDPIDDAAHWHHQDHSYSCAIVTQMEIYEALTGVHVPEDSWANYAQDHGWYSPDTGTQPGDFGKLLESMGIHTETQYDSSLTDIANALEHGDKVMVAINANDIWHPHADPTTGQPVDQPVAGHAVWVTGIVEHPDGTVQVVLNDSGTPDGAASTVDANDFLNGWKDFGNMAVTAHPEQATA